MFRKCQLHCFAKASAVTLMIAKPTMMNRLGRRKGGAMGLDDSEFIGRTNHAASSSSSVFNSNISAAEDRLEGEEDYAAFMAARDQHMNARHGGQQQQQQHRHLNPLSSSSSADKKNVASSSASSSPVDTSAFKGKGKRIVVNAGGQLFETFEGTLLQYPRTPFGQLILEQITEAVGGDEAAYANATQKLEIFLDVDPKVFNFVMQFLRSGKMVLPTDDEPLRFAINNAVQEFGLLDVAFPPMKSAEAIENESNGGDSGDSGAMPMVRLPDVCVIQMCDHLQHDQGIKRHALNISYGSDGFAVKDLCKKIRKDLNGQLSNTYWQCYQTHERSMFLITTKIANGTADMMMASVTQRLIEHTEQAMGYRLVSSYVTLSPDIKNTNVRLFIHNLIFRRVRNPSLEDTDAVQLFSNPDGSISAAMGVVSGMQHEQRMANRSDETFTPNEEMFRNFEPPSVGPQDSYGKLGMPLTAPAGQRVPGNIWSDDE